MGNAIAKHQDEQFANNPHIQRILEAREKLTGWERVKLLFTPDSMGRLPPEVARMITGTTMGLVAGCGIGALGRGRIAYQDFMRSNAHEIFETPLQARRKLQDSVTLGMGSGAFRVGWRMGLFTGIYMVVSTVTSTYRGKMGIIDQMAGAGAAGFLYKFHQGPKAAFAGGAIGSLLGVFAGVMTLGIMKLTGQTIDHANLMYYSALAKSEEKAQAKTEFTRETLRKYDHDPAEPDKNSLTLFHQHMLEERGVDASNKRDLSTIPDPVPESSSKVVPTSDKVKTESVAKT